MSPYIHELPGWPEFRWDSARLAGPLAALRHRQGRLIGRMENLGFSLRAEATLQTLTTEIINSSEIEGETLHHDRFVPRSHGGWEWTSERSRLPIAMSKAWSK
jgi:Fic family protein